MNKLIGGLAAAILAATSAHAEIVTFDYTAVVTSTKYQKTGNPQGEVAQILTPNGSSIFKTYTVHGTYTIDTWTLPSMRGGGSIDPNVAAVYYDDFPSETPYTYHNTASMVVDRTGYTLAGGQGKTAYYAEYRVFDGVPDIAQDRFYAGLSAGFGTYVESLELNLSRADGKLWAGTELPTRFDFSALDSATLEYTYYRPIDENHGEWRSFSATLTSLTQRVTPVPEPTTYAMLGAGLLAVGAATRRRRRVIQRA